MTLVVVLTSVFMQDSNFYSSNLMHMGSLFYSRLRAQALSTVLGSAICYSLLWFLWCEIYATLDRLYSKHLSVIIFPHNNYAD